MAKNIKNNNKKNKTVINVDTINAKNVYMGGSSDDSYIDDESPIVMDDGEILEIHTDKYNVRYVIVDGEKFYCKYDLMAATVQTKTRHAKFRVIAYKMNRVMNNDSSLFQRWARRIYIPESWLREYVIQRDLVATSACQGWDKQAAKWIKYALGYTVKWVNNHTWTSKVYEDYKDIRQSAEANKYRKMTLEALLKLRAEIQGYIDKKVLAKLNRKG